MKTLIFLLSLAALSAAPALAQLGPAGVPGAPGLAPSPAPATSPSQSLPGNRTQTAPSIPPACAKAKNVKQCVARQELRRKARAACKGKQDAEYRQCFDGYLRRHGK